jgi:hypothetical protein
LGTPPVAEPPIITPTPKTPFQELNAKIGEALKGGGKLPEGYRITPLGKIQNAQGKFIGAAELTQIAETLKSPVNLSQRVSNLSGKALGAASKAVNVAMIADFFLNPESLGFQNLSASDMGSYEEAEIILKKVHLFALFCILAVYINVFTLYKELS